MRGAGRAADPHKEPSAIFFVNVVLFVVSTCFVNFMLLVIPMNRFAFA
jgi:hypothetical protein